MITLRHSAKSAISTILYLAVFLTSINSFAVSLNIYYWNPQDDPSREFFVIIHGRGASKDSDYIQGLAAAVHNRMPLNHIYILDWSELSTNTLGWIGFGGEDNIPYVGQYLAERFQNVDSTRINLIGHSWGSLVAYEASRNYYINHSKRINSLIAIEPAEDVPTGYDTALADFGRFSSHSWSLTTPNIASSAITPITADESFVVLGSDHTELVRDFSKMLSSPLGNYLLSLERLFSGIRIPNIIYDMLNYSGKISYNAGYDINIDRFNYASTSVIKPLLNLSFSDFGKTVVLDWKSVFNFKILFSGDAVKWSELSFQPKAIGYMQETSRTIYEYRFMTSTNSNYFFKLSDNLW